MIPLPPGQEKLLLYMLEYRDFLDQFEWCTKNRIQYCELEDRDLEKFEPYMQVHTLIEKGYLRKAGTLNTSGGALIIYKLLPLAIAYGKHALTLQSTEDET